MFQAKWHTQAVETVFPLFPEKFLQPFAFPLFHSPHSLTKPCLVPRLPICFCWEGVVKITDIILTFRHSDLSDNYSDSFKILNHRLLLLLF